MRLRTRFAAAATCLILVLTRSSAARPDVTWAGPSGGAWSLADNWDPKQVPNNAGSILFNATVNADGPIVDGGFSVRGLTVNDQVMITSGNLGFGLGTLAVGNTFLNGNGVIRIEPGMNQAPTTFVVQGGTTLTLSGNGSILMGGLGRARILGGPGGTLNNTSWRIIGEGNLCEGFIHLRNDGTITASGGSLVLAAAGYTNAGLMSALTGSILRINGSFGSMTNGGTILADGGIVQLAQGLIIDGGTLATTSGGLIATATGGLGTMRLSNLTNAGHFLSLGGTNTDLEGAIDNRGTFTIETGGHLRVAGTATLSGGGTVLLQPLSDIGRSGVTDGTLVITANTISGSGRIGLGDLRIVNEPDGVIDADNGSITIAPGEAGLRNTGTIGAGGGIGAGTLVFSGEGGGSFDNRFGHVRLSQDSRLLLNNVAVVAGGSISGGTVVVPAGQAARMNAVRLESRLEVAGSIGFSGNIDGSGVHAIETAATMLLLDDTTFNAGHDWKTKPGSNIRAAPGGGGGPEGIAPELFNNGTFAGAGNVGLNTLKITNNGTIRADEGTAQAPLALNVDPSPEGLLNAGVLESDNFGVLLLTGAGGGSFTQQGTALVRALGASSNVRLGGQTFSLTGGQLGSGAGSIAVDGGTTATLADLTSDALLTMGLGQATIVINHNVINNGTVSLPGLGRLVVAGASTLNSASGHIQSNGSITVNNNGNLDANIIAGTGSLLVQSGGTLRAHAIRQGRFTIDNGGFAHLKSAFTGSADPSRVGSLTLGAAPAFIDVANRVLIIDQSGTIALNTLRNHIVNGYNDGTWDGPGIRSSNAAANPGHGVAYGEASAIFSSFPATYFGETIDNTTLLVTYTRYGDANLDRAVNLQDFNRLAANFGQSNKLWTDGDFTYDGVVNLQDFNRLAANFGLGAAGPHVTPPDWAALASAVPEPAGLIAVVSICGLVARVRRAS